MLDFFAVITKGGLVLWYFQDVAMQLNTSVSAVNSLIRDVVLQERGCLGAYDHGNLALKMKLDNEFDLLFIVIYQRILQLSYVDKFLSDIQLEFRDRFKDQLQKGMYFQTFNFADDYVRVLRNAEEETRIIKSAIQRPRTFEESEKSKKTVESMIERRGGDQVKKYTKKKVKNKKEEDEYRSMNNSNNKKMLVTECNDIDENELDESPNEKENEDPIANKCPAENSDEESIIRNRERMMANKRLTPKGGKAAKSPKATTKKGKEARVWEFGGKDTVGLDYSKKTNGNAGNNVRPDFLPDLSQIGSLRGNLRGIEISGENETKRASRGGMLSLFKGLVGGRTLTTADISPVMEKLKDHLIAKNVAAEIAYKLCDSVVNNLEGKHIGTFEGITTTVRTALTESLVQLLTPKRRLDILRDIVEAKNMGRPYSVTFCGVNGVGKSTNLAKIAFWLVENGYRVLIAACDTFRAGAVEQLRTHTHHLNALHPPQKHEGKIMVQLFEQGYGKDAAEIARYAIEFSKKNDFDVVLIDTAGRMQDNEPLMRALAKLIHVNEPDLALFVGEALVGNEAVDQLVKFNRALSNFSSAEKTQMIDGIVLTKFDTIDDKVGAAISMTYITGQPIVFVGTGQTYADLRNLDAKSVIHSLMK